MEWGCSYTRGLGQALPVTSEQRQEGSQRMARLPSEDIQAKGEPVWPHSDMILPFSLPTSSGYLPDSTRFAEGAAQQGASTRSRPPAPLCVCGAGPASLLEVLIWAGSQHPHSQSPQPLGPALTSRLGYEVSRHE